MFACKRCGKFILSFKDSYCTKCRIQIEDEKKTQQLKEEEERRRQEEEEEERKKEEEYKQHTNDQAEPEISEETKKQNDSIFKIAAPIERTNVTFRLNRHADSYEETTLESLNPLKAGSNTSGTISYVEILFHKNKPIPVKIYTGCRWHAGNNYIDAFFKVEYGDEFIHFMHSISGSQLMQKYPLPSDEYCLAYAYENGDIAEKQIHVPYKINNKTVIGLGHYQSTITDYAFFSTRGYRFDAYTDAYTNVAIPLTPTSISLPRSLKFIMGMWGYASLNDIVLPKGLEYIGIGTFSGSSIESIVIPGSVQVIDKESFITNTLKYVVIEEGVKRIGKYAFGFFPYRQSMSSLNFVSLPRSIQYIDPTAFTGYTGSTKYDINLDGERSEDNLKNYQTRLEHNQHLASTIFLVPSGSYAQRFVKEMGYSAYVIGPEKETDPMLNEIRTRLNETAKKTTRGTRT